MKRKILAFLTAAMCFVGGVPVNAIAETAGATAQASEAAKTGTLTVTVYNEDEGGLYTDELDITICGSSNVNIGSEMDGTIMLCGFDTSESNPFVLENFEIHQDYRYNVIDISTNNFDGYDYVMDYDRFDKDLVFTDAADQKYDIYMKKQYYIVHSDTSISTDKYDEEAIKNINEVDWLLRDLINSDTFKVRDMVKRQYLAKSMLMSLCEFKMLADWSFDEAENVMSFTYNCGMTGQLRPAIFKDEHKQLENVKLEDAEAVVRATILGIRDHEVIIKPVRGSWESWAAGGDLSLSTSNFNNSNITPNPGMKLEITYNKGFLEGAGARFVNVLKIKVLSEDAGLIKGDANCDEDVDMSDVVLIMQALANPDRYGGIAPNYYGITELGKLNGDMNGDGLTVGDAQAIQRKLLGLDSESIEIKPELGDIVSIKTPYRPAMSDWSGIGILLEFDSKDYSITLSTNEGHFTTWDIETGDGVVTNVGKTYDVGNSGYIFWTPDDLKYFDDFENEITVKGKNGDAQIELGKIYVTKDNQSNKSDLIASLERKRTMTIYDVKELAKKDGEFTWADFEAYSGRKCGTPFNMLAYIYEIDESYYLFVSGAVNGAPDQVQLCHYNEHISVDVLTGDVEAFIAEYSDYELPDIGYTFDDIYNMTEDEVRTVFNEKGLTDTEKYHVYPQRNGNTAVDNNSMTVLLYPENYMINLTDHELVTHVTNINDQDKLFKNSDIIWDREKVRKSLGLPKEYFYFEDVSSMGVTKSAPEGEDPDIRKYCQCSIRCTSEDKDKIADLRRAALNYIQLNPDFALVYPETYGG